MADRAADATSHFRLARTIAALLFAIWLAGLIILIARLLRGAITMSGIRRRSRASGDERVLISDEIDIPCAVGVFAPVVIVPAESVSWNDSDWNAVLLHERGHLERRDVLMHWVRQIALALHWFNPAVHWLDRVAGEACEGHVTMP